MGNGKKCTIEVGLAAGEGAYDAHEHYWERIYFWLVHSG